MLYSLSQLSNGIVIFITWSAEAAVADNQQDRNHGGTFCFEHCGKGLDDLLSKKCFSGYLELSVRYLQSHWGHRQLHPKVLFLCS